MLKLKKTYRFMSLLICLSILAGALAVVSAAETSKIEKIIITTQDEGYKEEGDWKDSDVLGYDKTASRHGSAKSTATWTPDITEAGLYKVYFYKVVNQSESDERGRVDVFHSEGSDSKFFDFTSGESDWMDMGIFYFEAGRTGYVKVVATEYARASAVRFERIAEVDDDEFPPMFVDIDESPHQQEITVMGGLGIFNGYSDNTFRPDDNITRGEFAATAVRLMGMTEIAGAYTGDNAFHDVGGSYFGLREINLVASLGIINGYGEGAFGPNDYLTYEQAVKIMVTLLGYKVQAESEGGYPWGYLTVAANLKIISGVTGAAGQPITRGNVAKMAYNALPVPLMEQSGTIGQDGVFNVSNDVTVLSKYLHMTRVDGVVSANENTTLLEANHNAKGEVVINEQAYRVGETGAENYLGYFVTAYAKEEANSSERRLVFVYPRTGQNEKLVIKADNISSTTTKRQLDYWSDGRNVSVKISPIARMIYNGVALSSYEDAHLKPLAGKVELLDRGNSGEYDTIIVTSYINYVVNNFSKETKKVYCKYNTYLSLDKPGIKCVVTKDGKEIDLDALTEWDVLSVAVDKEIINADGSRHPDFDNAKMYTIKVSNEKVEGNITATQYMTDGNGVHEADSRLLIMGREYMFAQNLRAAFATGGKIAPVVGDTGTFYLDFEGKIAAVDISAGGSYMYGYVINAAVSGSLDKEAQLKILTQKNEKVVVLNVRSTVELIDPNPVENHLAGKEYQGNISADDLAQRFWDESSKKFVPALIAYKTDNEGKIRTVCKAVRRETNPPADYPLILGKEISKAWFHKMKFAQQFYITPNTIIFKVPNQTRVNNNIALDTEYEVVPSSWFTGGEHYVIPYNMTDANAAQVMVFSDSKDGISVSRRTSCTIIDRVSGAVNKDGEMTKIIHGYTDGEKISATFSSATLEKPLRRGDVVKLALNSDNEITAMEVIRTVSELRECITNPDNYKDYFVAGGEYGEEKEGDSDYGNEKRYVTGTPVSKDADTIRLEVVGHDRDEIAIGLAGKKVVIYDELEDEIYVGGLGDIIDEKTRLTMGGDFVSKCFLQTVWADPVSLFYYKFKPE